MVEYLPDKHGKISRCGAEDPTHCRYHVGPDGRPLKHYHTEEAARKAYEESMKGRKAVSLKKPRTKKVEKRIDPSFLPKQLRGLSIDQINGQLDHMIEDSKNEKKAYKKRKKELRGKVDDLYRRLYDGDKSDKEMVRRANVRIYQYREDVDSAIKAVDDKIGWCKGNTRRSRQVLKELEAANPGKDYGSKEKDGVKVQEQARKLLEHGRPFLAFPIEFVVDYGNHNDYSSVVKGLSDKEQVINERLYEIRGVSGIPGEIKVKDLTQPEFRTYDGLLVYESSRINKQSEKDHPELAKEYDKAVADLKSLKDHHKKNSFGLKAKHMKWFVPQLKGIHPVDTAGSRKIIKALSDKAYDDYNYQFRDELKSMTIIGADDDGDSKRYLVRRKLTDLDRILGESEQYIMDDTGKGIAAWPHWDAFEKWSQKKTQL